MASSSLSSLRARVTRFSFRQLRLPVIGIAAAAIAVSVLPTGIGSATPQSHLSLSQVEAQISVLNNRVERISEAYDTANTQLKALQRKEQVTNRMLATDRATLTTVQRRVAAGAAAAYRTGGLDPTL